MPLVYKQAIAVIDARTTVVCLDINGIMVPVDEPFSTLAGDFQAPPFHVHCRTLVAPHQPGFISAARKAANEELKRRPMKERRKGPDGIGGTIPHPENSNPPSGFSRRDENVAAREQDLLFENQRKLKAAGKGADFTEADGWEPTARQVPEKVAFGGATEADAAQVVAGALVPLPEAVRKEVETYTGERFEVVNRELRAGFLSDETRRVTAGVVAAWEAQKPLTAPVIAYRGMAADFLPDGALTGVVLKDLAVLSTTMKQYKATVFTQEAMYQGKIPLMLEIMVPAGEKVLAANIVEGSTEAKDLMKIEAELILPPGTELLLLSEMEDGVYQPEGAGQPRKFKKVRAMVVPKGSGNG